jgi:hypothetical protein
VDIQVILVMAARPPKKPEPRDDRLDAAVLVRMAPTERDTYAALAKADQRSLSAWIRIACQEKARRESAQA